MAFPRIALLVGGAVLLAAPVALPSVAATASSAAPAPAASQCKAGERIVYTCRFGKAVGSVCAKDGAVAYRYGPAGKPDIEIASAPDYANVRQGGVVGGGGGQQSNLRFTRGDHNYIVYWGYAGSLTDNPGKNHSGIQVMQGDRDLGALNCKGGRSASAGWSELVAAVPQEDDPRFDAWF